MPDEKDEKVASSATKDVTSESSPETKDAKENSSDSEKPWNKDPRFKEDNETFKLGKSIKALMDANELEDPDDLFDLITSGKKVHGKQIDLDNLDSIVAKAQTLDKYEEHWSKQEELKRRGAETPEETIARLQRDKETAYNREKARQSEEHSAREAKKAISFYENEVSSSIKEVEGLTNAEREYLQYAMGIGNASNEIELTDRKQIKRVLNDTLKKHNEFVKAVKDEAVKEYLAGKTSIPKVPSTDSTAATTKEGSPGTLKEARKAMHEILKTGGFR